MQKKNLFIAVTLFALFLISFHPASYAQSENQYYPAQVKDISDRKYEPAVIELLDNAKESIAISMYIIQSNGSGPVKLLLRDLEEALDRGVSVDIYLNTYFQDGRPLNTENDEAYDILKKKGGRVFGVTPSARMHDKLIIVDNRYVVIGSANWSISALKNNYESTTLVDSPGFAKEMFIRVSRHTLKGEEPGKPRKEPRAKNSVILDEKRVVPFDSGLLTDKALFPRMVTDSDARAMDTYILLKAYAVEQESDEYFISLEQAALDLGMPSDYSDSALRRQVIKVLEKLQDRYKLIKVNFKHGEDAWVTLKGLSADTFGVQGKFLNPEYLSRYSASAKFVIFIKALLEKEGKTLDSFTRKDLSERFGIDVKTLRRAINEISGNN